MQQVIGDIVGLGAGDIGLGHRQDPGLAGSMLKPAPGRTSSPTARPITSARVETTSKIDDGLAADAAEFLHVAHLGDAQRHGAEDHRRDHHLDQLDEGVAQGLQGGASLGP